MNVVKFDLKRIKNIVLVFNIIMILYLTLTLCLYPVLTTNKDSFNNLINNLPSLLKKALGIKSTLEGILNYYALTINIVLIIGALYAIFLGFFLILKDKKDNVSSFYLNKPISEISVIKQKIIAGILALLISCLLYHIISIILIFIFKNESINIWTIFQINSSIFLLEIVFFLVGMLIGLFINKKRTFIIPSIITIFIFEEVHLISNALNITILKYINPFSYFNVLDILNTGSYQYRFIVITVFLVIFLYNFIINIYKEKNED